MGKSIATLNVNFVAGVTEFVNDTERAQVKMRQFGETAKTMGSHSVSGVQATSAALRDLEGKFTTNLRAAERFVATTLGLGNVLQNLFPLAGGLAFGGMLYELGTRIAEVVHKFKEMEEAPARIRESFQSMNAPIAVSNDELLIANDRLQNEIAKLEHKPQNNVKLALDEARLASDKLSESMQKTFAEIQKTLEGTKIGFLDQIMGSASGSDLDEMFGGKTGAGGFRGQLSQVYSDYAEKIRAAGTEEDRASLRRQRDVAENKLLSEALSKVNAEIDKDRAQQAQRANRVVNQNAPYGGVGPAVAAPGGPDDQVKNIERLQGVRERIEAAMEAGALTIDNTALTSKKAGLAKPVTTSDATKDFSDKLRELQNQLDQARDKAKYFGDDLAQKVAAGVDKARASIEALNAKRLSEGLSKLTQPQEGQISSLTYQEALAQHAYEQDQQMRQHVLEDIRKNAEEKKQAFELDVKHMTDYVGEMEKLAQKQGELTHSEKLSMADQAHIDANRYLSEAAYGDRDEKFKAQLVAMRAEMRGANAPEKDIASKTELAVSDHALQEKQRGKDMTISDGYKSFFKQLKDNANSAGQNVQEVMSAAFNGIGDQLTAMLSGQKSSWAGFFQSLAGSFAKAGLNSIFGAIGSAASGGGNFFSKLLSGFRADGGSVSSGGAYVVGERGPELFMPSSAGSIVPNHALSGAGAGGYHQTIQVDARGTDPNLTERNVKRAIQQANANAVRSAMMANAELSRRRR